MEISKTFKFEAAHILPKHPGKCSRLHGHSWVLEVAVNGAINKETGFVMDYADLKSYVQPIVDQLDHSFLGAAGDHYVEFIPTCLPVVFYPSSENLLTWLATQLYRLNWSRLTLNETCTSSCTLTRKEHESQ